MNPSWCKETDCYCLTFMDTLGGGKCIGKLRYPTDHITKGVNTMQRCHYDKTIESISPFHINLHDCIIDIYLIGEALRATGAGIPQAIVNNLPIGENK